MTIPTVGGVAAMLLLGGSKGGNGGMEIGVMEIGVMEIGVEALAEEMTVITTPVQTTDGRHKIHS